MAASSQMETAHMAGKSRQPSHEPPWGRRKTDTRHTDKTVKRKRETGKGRQPPRSPHTQENANAQKTLMKMATKLLQGPMDQEHEESWRMRISNKPLTAKVKLVLLVVNSVKLYLTAYNPHFKYTYVHSFHSLTPSQEQMSPTNWPAPN